MEQRFLRNERVWPRPEMCQLARFCASCVPLCASCVRSSMRDESFVAKRDYRIDACRAAGWNETRQNRDQPQDKWNGCKDDGVRRGDVVQKAGHKSRKSERSAQSKGN